MPETRSQSRATRPRSRRAATWRALMGLSLASVWACGAPETAEPPPSLPDVATAVPTPSPRDTPRPLPGIATVGSVPSGFPGDVPTYPGAVPNAALEIPGQNLLATFQSDDLPIDILRFYREALTQADWQITERPDDGVLAEKDGRELAIRARPGALSPTEIIVSVSPDP